MQCCKYFIWIFGCLTLMACQTFHPPSVVRSLNKEYIQSIVTPPLVIPAGLSLKESNAEYSIPTAAKAGGPVPAPVQPPEG